jgi:hypothetical protein
LLFACQNRHSKSTVNIPETKSTINGSVVASDTAKGSSHSDVLGTAGAGPGIKKDSIPKTVGSNAIIHNSSDQEKLDSIKNAKKKIKNQ